VVIPIIIEAHGATYPADGVIPTNPAKAPQQNETAENFFDLHRSIITHVNAPEEAEMVETNAAIAARAFASSAEPALKPNQPNLNIK
jgi:hypothetical protein